MPFETIVVVSAIVAAFAAFAVTLISVDASTASCRPPIK